MTYYHEHPAHEGYPHEYAVSDPDNPRTVYAVSAVGGGTPGRDYGPGQAWHYTITDPDNPEAGHPGPWSGSDLIQAGTHADAAEALRDFYTA